MLCPCYVYANIKRSVTLARPDSFAPLMCSDHIREEKRRIASRVKMASPTVDLGSGNMLFTIDSPSKSGQAQAGAVAALYFIPFLCLAIQIPACKGKYHAVLATCVFAAGTSVCPFGDALTIDRYGRTITSPLALIVRKVYRVRQQLHVL